MQTTICKDCGGNCDAILAGLKESLGLGTSAAEIRKSCCIRDGCGMPFDPTALEVREAETLRAFPMMYCPKHRALPEGQRQEFIVDSPERCTSCNVLGGHRRGCASDPIYGN